MPLPEVTRTTPVVSSTIANDCSVKAQSSSTSIFGGLRRTIANLLGGPQLTREQYKEAQRIAGILRGDSYGMMAGYSSIDENSAECKTLKEISWISLDNLGRVNGKLQKACTMLLKHYDDSTKTVKKSDWYKA